MDHAALHMPTPRYHRNIFNMPLELGIFLGARHFGDREQQMKAFLVLDRERYRYQKYCSDISGQDIKSHGGEIRKAIRVVRDWLRSSAAAGKPELPSGMAIFERYERFVDDLPTACRGLDLNPAELTFNDYTTMIGEWLAVEIKKSFPSADTRP